MREIKYRVWDKRIGKMGEVTEIRLSKVQNNLVKYRYTDDRGKIIDEQSHFDKGFSNGLDIMQYTGLKDKNDKEIYEGDIIKAGWHGYKAVVTWQENSVRFIGEVIGEKAIVYVDMVDKDDISAVKVIGNIYENPELI